MRKGRDGGKNGKKKREKKKREKKEKRRMKIVATTSLHAVNRPNVDRLERRTLVPKHELYIISKSSSLKAKFSNLLLYIKYLKHIYMTYFLIYML